MDVIKDKKRSRLESEEQKSFHLSEGKNFATRSLWVLVAAAPNRQHLKGLKMFQRYEENQVASRGLGHLELGKTWAKNNQQMK